MNQKSGETCTGQADLQPISFKPDRLPAADDFVFDIVPGSDAGMIEMARYAGAVTSALIGRYSCHMAQTGFTITGSTNLRDLADNSSNPEWCHIDSFAGHIK